MKRTMTAISLALSCTAAVSPAAFAQDTINIEVGYPYSALFDVTFERIMPLFEAAHPEIEVTFRATYEHYEDGTNIILREAVAGELPDVTLQGLNRQQILSDREIARSLEPFIAAEEDFARDGYHEAMLSIGTFDGEVYGLPFAVSLPVGYYNMDLMGLIGVTEQSQLPTTWDEVIDMCGQLREAGVDNPLFWGWNITGNWFLQALMWSQGTPILDGNDFQLDTPEGLVALETMNDLFEGCNMQNLSVSEAATPFSAGNVAMYYWSTSSVGSIERSMGDFEMMTNEYPGIDGTPQGLPAGGLAAMLTSTGSEEEVQAAWTFIKFITSGQGAAAVAETTGYMPPNRAANALLADFYVDNPNKETAVRQADLLQDWIAYPGDNGLAITQVIYDGMEGIVTGDREDMVELQQELTEDVQDLLPN